MYDTFLEPLHNYLLHLLTSRTPPVLQKNMRCAEYSSGDRRGPTLMGTPRHCTNHAFRAVRQWGGRGPTLMSTPWHSKKPCVLCGTASRSPAPMEAARRRPWPLSSGCCSTSPRTRSPSGPWRESSQPTTCEPIPEEQPASGVPVVRRSLAGYPPRGRP